MNLGELTNLVCLKTHRNDDDAKAEARAYLRARYEMVWNAHLWRDAMCEILVPAVDVNDREIILPGIVDRVVNVLFDNQSIENEARQIIYRAETYRILATENPQKFSILAPSAVGRIPGGVQLRLTTDTPDEASAVSIRGQFGNEEHVETVTLNGLALVDSVFPYAIIFSLSKANPSINLTVMDIDGNTLLALAVGETSRSFQRITLQSQPREQKTVSVLAKRRIKPLVADEDAPELTGIDNALLAFGIGDVLEGQRQYGKAQAKFTEGSAIVTQMTNLEREQSASTIRLVPDGGWDDYDWRSESCHF